MAIVEIKYTFLIAHSVANYLLLLLSVAAIVYYLFIICVANTNDKNFQPVFSNFNPPVTILKPICGLDADAYTNLISFCQQDYSTYEIIFCVRDYLDPCIPIIRQIMNELPDLDIQLVICNKAIGTNLKVSNLANALPFAKHEIILIADSDIRVGTDYLQQVIIPLQNKNVGVVTCLYRSIVKGWVTTLEAMAIMTNFHPGILASQKLEGIKFALGSTIVIRKEVLEAIGTFSKIADYLGDDYQLGYLASQIGYEVVLSNYIVEHVIANTNLTESIQRQTRWAKGVRVSRPWGYVGLIFTHGITTSLLLLISTGVSVTSLSVLIITWAMRVIMGWIVGIKILQDDTVKKYFWLMPISDIINFFVWCSGFINDTIKWRGRYFKLIKEGKIIPIDVLDATTK